VSNLQDSKSWKTGAGAALSRLVKAAEAKIELLEKESITDAEDVKLEQASYEIVKAFEETVGFDRKLGIEYRDEKGEVIQGFFDKAGDIVRNIPNTAKSALSTGRKAIGLIGMKTAQWGLSDPSNQE